MCEDNLKAVLWRYLSNAVHLQNSFKLCTEGFLKRFNYSHTLGSNHSISVLKPKYKRNVISDFGGVNF